MWYGFGILDLFAEIEVRRLPAILRMPAMLLALPASSAFGQPPLSPARGNATPAIVEPSLPAAPSFDAAGIRRGLPDPIDGKVSGLNAVTFAMLQ